MPNAIRRILLLPVAAFAAVSCSDDTPTAAPPELEMSGTVELRDEGGATVSPDGVSVAAIPDAGPAVFTTTGPDGSWSLPAPAPGSYVVEFRRSGFGLVRLEAIPHDSSGVDALVPALSTATVTELSASVDPGCGGPSPCLDLTARIANQGLYPEGRSRRILRAFLGTPGEVGPNSYDQTFSLVVNIDDPLMREEGETVVIEFQSLRGLDLSAAEGGNLAVLLLGATENDIFGSPDPDDPAASFPDLAPQGAEALVIP